MESGFDKDTVMALPIYFFQKLTQEGQEMRVKMVRSYQISNIKSFGIIWLTELWTRSLQWGPLKPLKMNTNPPWKLLELLAELL